MILKKVFNPLAIFRYLWRELLWSILLSSLVFGLHQVLHLRAVFLPFSIAAILGSGLAIFIAFRNQSAYARWWEARTIWGNIVNHSRVWARLIITFADAKSNQAHYQAQASTEFKTQLVKMQIAWVHLLRLQLRQESQLDQALAFLSPSVQTLIQQAQNKPHALQMQMGKEIYQALNTGILAGFDGFQLEGQLLALAQQQGACERIKNTPLLRQYHFFTKLFLWVFMLCLPLALVQDFEKMGISFLLIPVSVLVSFVFATMAKVGEVNENPFENQITDVPLTALCNTIERDLLESLHEPVPPKIQPSEGILY